MVKRIGACGKFKDMEFKSNFNIGDVTLLAKGIDESYTIGVITEVIASAKGVRYRIKTECTKDIAFNRSEYALEENCEPNYEIISCVGHLSAEELRWVEERD